MEFKWNVEYCIYKCPIKVKLHIERIFLSYLLCPRCKKYHHTSDHRLFPPRCTYDYTVCPDCFPRYCFAVPYDSPPEDPKAMIGDIEWL